MAFVAHYISGFLYIYNDLEEYHDNATSDSEHTLSNFILVYMILIPFISSLISCLYKLYDDGGKFSKIFRVMLVLTWLQAICGIVFAYIFSSPAAAAALTVFGVLLIYGFIQLHVYIKNDWNMPKVFLIINSIIVAIIVLAGLVISIFSEDFHEFYGATVTCGLIAALFLGVSIFTIFKDNQKAKQAPVFYSPWIFPVYQYNPKKNNVRMKNYPAVFMFLGFGVIIGWSFLCSIFVKPL